MYSNLYFIHKIIYAIKPVVDLLLFHTWIYFL